MANQFLSLSLFLMLLSFFIVLNSVSDFENTKAVPTVLNSLSLAFKNEHSQGDTTATARQENEFQDKRDGNALEDVEGLFNAHIAGFEARKNRLGTVMHVRLPMRSFENALKRTDFGDADVPSQDQEPFLNTLVTVLRSAQKKKPYRIDMVMNVGDDPAILMDTQPKEYRTAVKRVSNLSKALENMKLPRKMISTGLKRGERGFIDLYFYRYKPMQMPFEAKASKQNAGP